MSEILRVGVIGAGNMGRHHIRNYSEMENTELVAVADPAINVLETDLHGAKGYESYENMLEEAKPDAVSIAVPTPMHFDVASKALGMGIHTLVEKPIASTIEEAEDLVALSQETGAILTVGHIERYNPVVAEVKKVIDDGRLGTISSVISKRLGGFPKNEPKTDVIADLAVHDIDIIAHLVSHEGEFLAAHGTNTFHSSEIDSAEILMRYNGASGFIQANWVSPVKIRQIAITGSKGYITANYVNQEVTFYEENVTVDNPTDFKDFVSRLGSPNTHVLSVEQQEPLRRELGAFTLAAAGGEPEILVSPDDAISALRIAKEAVEDITRRQPNLNRLSSESVIA